MCRRRRGVHADVPAAMTSRVVCPWVMLRGPLILITDKLGLQKDLALHVLRDVPMERRRVLHKKPMCGGRLHLGATSHTAAHAGRRDGEVAVTRGVEQLLDVNDSADDINGRPGEVALLEQLDEVGEACDVSVLQEKPNSACKLITIEVRVSNGKKRDVDVSEDAALKKPAKVGEHDGVLVLPNTIVQLQVESFG